MTLNDYVQLTRRGLLNLAKAESNSDTWGYGYCATENDKELTELYHAAKMLRDQDLIGATCLCQEELENIKSRIHKILGPECHTEDKDYSVERRADADAYIKANPGCVAYVYLADYLAAQCALISVDFKVVQKKCEDVDLDLKVTAKIICDAVDLAVSIEEHTCPKDIDVTVNLQECIVDLQTVITETKCDIDLNTYVRLVSCGADVKTIITQLNCGADINAILTGVDSCFTPIEDAETMISVSGSLPEDCSVYNCGNFAPSFDGLILVTTSCNCTKEIEGGVVVPVGILNGDEFGLNIGSSDSGTFSGSFPVICNGEEGEITLNVVLDSSEPIPCPGGFDLLTATITATDPCGNSVTTEVNWPIALC